MEPLPPGSSPLCLPRGEIVLYSTTRPSIRLLTQQIAALGYEVSGFPLQQTDLRQLPPGVWHRAVVIGGHILFIVDPGEVLFVVDRGERAASDLASFTSGYGSSAAPDWPDSDNVDPDFPEDGYGSSLPGSSTAPDWPDSDNVDPDCPEDGSGSSLP